jgi:hypothetical protein
MNGEYRSPGPARRYTTRRSDRSDNDFWFRRLMYDERQDAPIPSGDQATTSSGWDALELDAGTTPGIFSRNPNA